MFLSVQSSSCLALGQDIARSEEHGKGVSLQQISWVMGKRFFGTHLFWTSNYEMIPHWLGRDSRHTLLLKNLLWVVITWWGSCKAEYSYYRNERICKSEGSNDRENIDVGMHLTDERVIYPT